LRIDTIDRFALQQHVKEIGSTKLPEGRDQ
jgi:hypothetical protein